MVDNYESEILCFAHKDRANWHGAFRTAQGKPTPELWNEYALELCEEYLLQAKKLIKIEMRKEGDVIKKANVSKSLFEEDSYGNNPETTDSLTVKVTKEPNERLNLLVRAMENIKVFMDELRVKETPPNEQSLEFQQIEEKESIDSFYESRRRELKEQFGHVPEFYKIMVEELEQYIVNEELRKNHSEIFYKKYIDLYEHSERFLEIKGDYEEVLCNHLELEQKQGLSSILYHYYVVRNKEQFENLKVDFKRNISEYYYVREDIYYSYLIKFTKVRNEYMPPVHTIENKSVESLYTYYNRAFKLYNSLLNDLKSDYPLYLKQKKLNRDINRYNYPPEEFDLLYGDSDVDNSYIEKTKDNIKLCYKYMKSLVIQIQTTSNGKNYPLLPDEIDYEFDDSSLALLPQPPSIHELKPVDQWDDILKAIILHKLFPDKTGYSLSKEYSTVLKVAFETLKKYIDKQRSKVQAPLNSIDSYLEKKNITVESLESAMRAFLNIKNPSG